MREGILKEFLEKNRAEAKNMSIFEYDQEKHMRQEREEAWEEGNREGLAKGRRNMLCELIQNHVQRGKVGQKSQKDWDCRKRLLRRFYKI